MLITAFSKWYRPDVRRLLPPLDVSSRLQSYTSLSPSCLECGCLNMVQQKNTALLPDQEGLLSFRLTCHTPASDRRCCGPPRRRSEVHDAAWTEGISIPFPPDTADHQFSDLLVFGLLILEVSQPFWSKSIFLCNWSFCLWFSSFLSLL